LTDAPWPLGTRFENALAEAATLTDAVLDKLIAVPPGLEARVFEAMRYAALAPGCYWGKRQVWVEGYGYRWRTVQICQ